MVSTISSTNSFMSIFSVGWGQTHYRVYKSDTETSTATHLIKLSEKERIEEIARMLSGSSLTAAALDNARELLKRNDLKDGKK